MIRDVAHMGADLKDRLEAIDREVEQQLDRTKRRVANLAKDEQLEEMRRDVGSELRLSRVRSGRGATIGVRYTIKDDEVLIAARGPVPLVASPMPAHDITSKRGKRLMLPDGGFRTTVHHPGTDGKDTWNEGVERATPKIGDVIGRDVDDAVRRSFKRGD